jgi:hypothetical protein
MMEHCLDVLVGHRVRIQLAAHPHEDPTQGRDAYVLRTDGAFLHVELFDTRAGSGPVFRERPSGPRLMINAITSIRWIQDLGIHRLPPEVVELPAEEPERKL